MNTRAPVAAILMVAGTAGAQCLWTPITPAGGVAPPARYRAAIAYDSARGRVVLFGGRTSNSTVLGDTWEWDGTAWALAAITGPAPRADHAMAFHPVLGKTILYGGVTDPLTWQWDGIQWSTLPFSNTSYAPSDFCMAYDTVHQRMFAYGGTSVNPVREMGANGQWINLGGTGPSSYIGNSMAFDPDRAMFLVQLPTTGIGVPNVFVFNAATPAGSWAGDVALPGAHGRAAMAYDAARRRMVLQGGINAGPFGGVFSDTLEFDGASWRKRADDGPGARSGACMVYDAAHASVLLYGGLAYPESGQQVMGDLWRYDGSQPDGMTIIQRPLSTQHRTINETATLGVIIQGATTYQWYRGAQALVDGGNISGATTASLTVGPLTLADAADYTVVVSAGCSPMSFLSTMQVSDPGGCWINCDHSTSSPFLNAIDFICFMNEFAIGSSYANCDQSTTPPVLNANDFNCYLNRFAIGCP